MKKDMFNYVMIAMVMVTVSFALARTASAVERPAPQFNANNAQSFAVNATNAGPSGYVRDGATVRNLRALSLSGQPVTASAVCANGEWTATNMTGTCYPSGSDTACNCAGECNTINYTEESGSLQVTSPNDCDGAYCFYETTDSPGSRNRHELDKRRGDHMFRIIAGGDGFLNFKQRTEKSYWFKRTGGPEESLMIPTSAGDFDRFIHNHPGTLHAEYACRPANLTLCPLPPAPRPRAVAPPNPPGNCQPTTPTECIATGQPVPPGQTACPTNECFFHVSGLAMASRSAYDEPIPGRPQRTYLTRVGDTSQTWGVPEDPSGSNLVGAGNYSDSYNGPFRRASRGTFDGMAIGRHTRVQIYSGTNFSGPVLFDQQGPIIVNNDYNIPTLDAEMVSDWGNSPLMAQFPPSVRFLSSDPRFGLPPVPNSRYRLWQLGGAPVFGAPTLAATSIRVSCIPPTNGACGSASGQTTSAAPSSNLCTSGTATTVTTSGSNFTWSCNGANGGVNASCSANKSTTSATCAQANCYLYGDLISGGLRVVCTAATVSELPNEPSCFPVSPSLNGMPTYQCGFGGNYPYAVGRPGVSGPPSGGYRRAFPNSGYIPRAGAPTCPPPL